ncbi:MAG: AAA family ATPase [Nitrososphaeraceae archaeon]
MERRKNKYIAKKIMILGTKGGVGKSFLAVNLAIDLFNQSRSNVILFDIDYKSADDATILNIIPQKTVYDILPIIDNLDLDLLENLLTTHSSGIKFLPAPIHSPEAEYISSEQTMKIIDILAEISDYIVIDTPAYFSEDVLSILERIDYMLIIATMDVLSIKNLKESLYTLKQLRFPRKKIILILNRSNSKVGLTIEEIENNIMEEIDINIPSDRLVPLSINKGIPLIIEMPKSLVSQNINKITQIIIKGI